MNLRAFRELSITRKGAIDDRGKRGRRHVVSLFRFFRTPLSWLTNSTSSENLAAASIGEGEKKWREREREEKRGDAARPRLRRCRSGREGSHASMELTRSVPPSPPLLSEERHRARGDITSPVRGRATTTITSTATTTATTTTTGSKRICNPVKSAATRHRQVALVETRLAREESSPGDEKTPENFLSPAQNDSWRVNVEG